MMSSISALRSNAAYGRIKSAASTLCSDNQIIVAVKKLEEGVLELLEASDNCSKLSNGIHSVGNEYQHGMEPNNFSKLLGDKFERLKAASASASQNNPNLRQFCEAIWNVHHTRQTLPGDELEDI